MGTPMRSARLRQGDATMALGGGVDPPLPEAAAFFLLWEVCAENVPRDPPGFPDLFVLATRGL
jgi:hypothetical protein